MTNPFLAESTLPFQLPDFAAVREEHFLEAFELGMTEQLAEAYTTAGNANNALVIPAGLAFARARAKQPELNLYAPDKRHPSPAGTYLAASTVFAVLTGKSPVGNSYHASIDEKTASFLQEIAWETVQDYYKK